MPHKRRRLTYDDDAVTLLALCREMRDEVRARLDHVGCARLQQTCRQLAREDPGLVLPRSLRAHRRVLPLGVPAFRWFLRDWHAAGMEYVPVPFERVVNLAQLPRDLNAARYMDMVHAGDDELSALSLALAFEWHVGACELVVISALDTPLVAARPLEQFADFHCLYATAEPHRYAADGTLHAVPRGTLFWQWQRFPLPADDNEPVDTCTSREGRFLTDVLTGDAFWPEPDEDSWDGSSSELSVSWSLSGADE
jgi:hypothetical protein